jgi:hypothetical protein
MVVKKSPGGSIYPYNYKGGELFGMHLGSFFANESGVIDRIKQEESFILKQNMKIGMWFDFYQTKMTDEVINEFINTICNLQDHIIKMAIVGCSFWDKRRFNRIAKKRISIPLKFYDDPEVAKTWLVTER